MYDTVNLERYANTDVRWIRFDKNRISMRLIYEKGQRVSSLVKKYNATFGFNLPYFWDGQILGNNKDGDNIISTAYGKMLKWHSIASNGSDIKIGKLNINDKFDFLATASPLIVENGQLCHQKYIVEEEVNSDIANGRSQRTAVGINKAGDLIVAICDGRTTVSQGLTLGELGQFMINKGAVIAMNGDGGGSTTLADQSGSLGMNKGSSERIVHHAVLVNVTPMPIMQQTASVIVNGNQVSTGFISNGVTYVPVRDVATNLGATVLWDGTTRTISINK